MDHECKAGKRPRTPPRRRDVAQEFETTRHEALAEDVAAEMATAWRVGRRLVAEEMLARHPSLQVHPEAAARVIYEEVCLREGLGQPAHAGELLSRFPQWRDEIRVLLDCHELVTSPLPMSALPKVGETLGDFTLRSVLGRGRRGCVFLATQGTLADRPVVLKVTRRGGGEHLSMARLQHPHVVPLYAVHEFADRDLRALCMPFLGGMTLDRVLDRLAHRPPSERRGSHLIGVLDEDRHELIASSAWSGPRQFLGGATYARAIGWVGACLAEGLHAAHARGLLHLDLKPSNVLLADDGQPMLLDFHLARGPVLAGSISPGWIGGTDGCTAPEHEAAMEDAAAGRAVGRAVDARADVYGLGVTLFEALAGSPPPKAGTAAARLLRANRRVGSGLAQVVAKCLAVDPESRYPDAASLAADLRRHLGHQSLQGVPRPGLFARCVAAFGG